MKRGRITGIVLATVLAFGVAGCGGGGAKAQTDIHTTTTGQELTDLKKALDSGALTQEEYEAQRKRILERE